MTSNARWPRKTRANLHSRVVYTTMQICSCFTWPARIACHSNHFNTTIYFHVNGNSDNARQRARRDYCSSDLPAFEELLDESDDRLFSMTLNNSTHTLWAGDTRL